MQNLKDMSLDELPAEKQNEIMAIMERAVLQAETKPTAYVNERKIMEYLTDGGMSLTKAEEEVPRMAHLFNEVVVNIIEQNNFREANEKMLDLFEAFIRCRRQWKLEQPMQF